MESIPGVVCHVAFSRNSFTQAFLEKVKKEGRGRRRKEGGMNRSHIDDTSTRNEIPILKKKEEKINYGN